MNSNIKIREQSLMDNKTYFSIIVSIVGVIIVAPGAWVGVVGRAGGGGGGVAQSRGIGVLRFKVWTASLVSVGGGGGNRGSSSPERLGRGEEGVWVEWGWGNTAGSSISG